MMSNKAWEGGNFRMVSISKDSLKMIFLMARVFFMPASLLKDYGAKVGY
jgi:hypothetical protein